MEEMVAGEIWMIASSISYFFFFPLSSWDSIFLFLFDTIVPLLTNPLFCLSFFWRGLMRVGFITIMFWLWEPFGRLVVGWGGSVTDHHKFLLFNQTYVLGNVWPELFFVYNCRSFLSVLLLFFTTDIHAFIYFTLFLREIFHPGVLISITHTNVYMSFTEWEWYCFFSFVEYNFEIVNI